MAIQLSLFLYIYYAFLAIWLIFILIAVYHMLKFGFKTVSTFLVTVIFLLVAATMLLFSFIFINQINWQTEISLFNLFTQPDIIID